MASNEQAFNQLQAAFQSSAQSRGLTYATPAYNDAFNGWLGAALQQLGVEWTTNWGSLPAYLTDVQPAQIAGIVDAATKGGKSGAADYIVNTYGANMVGGPAGEAMIALVNDGRPGEYELQAGEDTQSLPLEQALLERVMSDYILPDLDRDQQRRADAQGILDKAGASLDEALAVNRGAIDGTRLQEEYAMADELGGRMSQSAATETTARLAALDQQKATLEAALNQMSQDKTGALDAETEQVRSALAVLETERSDALGKLEQARLDAGESRVSGINQGLEGERDRIEAADALKGYVGGSSMKDAALARAAIDARQGAAVAIGDIKVQNAGDRRALGDEMSNSRFSLEGRDASGRRTISDEAATGRFNLSRTDAGARVDVENAGAANQRAVSDQTTSRRGVYFDNDFGRRMEAALRPATIESQRLAIMGAADDAGHTGLDRSLNTLNWWAGANTPPQAKPYQETASQFGSDIAGLGTGLTSAALSYANANDWWKAPTTKKPGSEGDFATSNVDPLQYNSWDF